MAETVSPVSPINNQQSTIRNPDASSIRNPHSAIRTPDASAIRNQPSAIRNRDGFLHIRVAGDPYEMGLQHGELLREEIRGLVDAVYRHVLYGQPGAVGWGIRRGARVIARLMAIRVPSDHREELRGISHAAGVSYRDLLLVNCFDDVLANLRTLAMRLGRFGCSAFARNAAPAAKDELWCGRNLDYFVPSAAGDEVWAATDFMKRHVVAIEHQPKGKAGFLSVGWPGFIGVATGLSEHALALAALVVMAPSSRPLGTPATSLYRRIMEEATSLEGAVAILRSARRTQGHNVLLASGDERTAAVVEYTPPRLEIRWPASGWIATTNHFNHPEMVRRHGSCAFLSSTERLARLGELYSRDGSDSAEVGSLAPVLLDTALRSQEADEYCTVLNPFTIYSTLFAPAQRRMWVRTADRPDRTFEEVAFGPAGL